MINQSQPNGRHHGHGLQPTAKAMAKSSNLYKQTVDKTYSVFSKNLNVIILTFEIIVDKTLNIMLLRKNIQYVCLL